MIRIAIHGITGKMGGYLFKALQESEDITIVAGICQTVRQNFPVSLYTSLEACLIHEDFDLLVDFSHYPASLEVVKQAIMQGKSVVSGTTGYKKYDGQHIRYLAEKHGVGVIISPNFSLSEGFIQYLLSCAERYPYIYISESHNITKKDKPSGTALFLARLMNVPMENIFAYRLPHVLAQHTIVFADDVERLEITHQTSSRDAFVKGTIEAIRLLAKEKIISIRI